ncbi:glycosyltransferase family 9 protein [Desulfonatronum thioautotrophicum]|uniref:glycosyltransferase family 9 protein n=1 Tax=Desulfonatronum thioautotrophicum TaxID=617001 RepID=UPI0005EBA9A0|nr:glycosyltransferase family 9 protein [Desulfonatronum thioautotrophicum]
METSSPKFLIIKPSSLGDIVHGLLVAQMIKVGLPQARIDWVCRDIFAPLVARCPVVDNILLFKRHHGLRGFLGLLREMRQREYTHVLDMQGLARSAVIARSAKAGKIIGRSDAREGARFAYHLRAPLPSRDRSVHAVAILAEFLPLLGLPRDVMPRLSFRAPGCHDESPLQNGVPIVPALHNEQRASCSKQLAKRSILLFPESSRPEKNWPGYGLLTSLLLKTMPEMGVVWAGAKSMPSPSMPTQACFLNMTGQTSLAELPDLLSQACLVVGNDSGPLHLAAAMGIPTLALFGPTSPTRYRPYPGDDQTNRVLRAPQEDMRLLQAEAALASILDML